MRAVHMTAPGDVDVLRTVQIPEPEIQTATQIKVRVKAAGINPIDTKLRSRGLFYSDALPAVLGLDGAGIIEAVGAGVTRFQPGDAVWYCHGGLGGAPGNYAEYHLIDEQAAQPKPMSIDFIQAAAAPLVLITAYEALFDRARMSEGKTVLIQAGAGGVGHVAIQLARIAGAKIITTVSTSEKAAYVRSLGADQVVNYRTEDLVEAVMDWTDGKGVDIALDTVGPEVFKASIPAVAHYGDLVTLLDPGPCDWKEARNRNIRIGFELMLTPLLRNLPQAIYHQGEILRQCAAWIDSGDLKIQIGGTYPLEQVAEAHRRIEEGHVQGKLVLTL